MAPGDGTVTLSVQPGQDAGIAVPQASYADTGLASVELNIPKRGTVYYFRAPRGEVELTAQSVRTTTIDRVTRTLSGLAIGAIVLLAIRRRKRVQKVRALAS